MKKFLFLLAALAFGACDSGSGKDHPSYDAGLQGDYRASMRSFVIKISEIARKTDPKFIVIPQNGQDVAWADEEEIVPDQAYFKAIDGCGREETFYGINGSYEIADGTLTPQSLSLEIQEMCDIYRDFGLTVLSTDYTTSDQGKIEDSFLKNHAKGYLSFAAPERELNLIPAYTPYDQNNDDIKSLKDAKNFLYLINPERYESKEAFLSALEETDYDLLIIDFYVSDERLTPKDIMRLKTKRNGGQRLIICYMSIGEAEDYRWYWKPSWNQDPPGFLCAQNESWEGNFKVRYWDPDWQNLIYGNEGYLSKILDAGFDGVYLDIIDAFEYFEENE